MESVRSQKLILALVSPVFEWEFYGWQREKSDKSKVVEINYISAEEFKTMIKFIYQNKSVNMEAELTKESINTLFSLLNLSGIYHLSGNQIYLTMK